MAETKTIISPIARVYGDLIVKGAKKFDQVPARLKEQVRQYLIDAGRGELAAE